MFTGNVKKIIYGMAYSMARNHRAAIQL